MAAAKSSSWRRWAHQAVDQGAGAAHRWTKERDEWKPETVPRQDGQQTAHPKDILTATGKKFGRLWGATKTPDAPEPLPAQRESLPRATPEEIRETCRKFRANTAYGTDGFSPRHIGWLPDAALEALATIYEAMECSSCTPEAWRHCRTPLIPKRSGGLRAIDVFAAPMRIWPRLRRGACDEWEAQHREEFFAAGRGSAASTPVWRAALRAEAGHRGLTLIGLTKLTYGDLRSQLMEAYKSSYGNL